MRLVIQGFLSFSRLRGHKDHLNALTDSGLRFNWLFEEIAILTDGIRAEVRRNCVSRKGIMLRYTIIPQIYPHNCAYFLGRRAYTGHTRLPYDDRVE
jgi:hypothetical protein